LNFDLFTIAPTRYCPVSSGFAQMEDTDGAASPHALKKRDTGNFETGTIRGIQSLPAPTNPSAIPAPPQSRDRPNSAPSGIGICAGA
jgi:hypothetical protein